MPICEPNQFQTGIGLIFESCFVHLGEWNKCFPILVTFDPLFKLNVLVRVVDAVVASLQYHSHTSGMSSCSVRWRVHKAYTLETPLTLLIMLEIFVPSFLENSKPNSITQKRYKFPGIFRLEPISNNPRKVVLCRTPFERK
jgi:hypothetical protein